MHNLSVLSRVLSFLTILMLSALSAVAQVPLNLESTNTSPEIGDVFTSTVSVDLGSSQLDGVTYNGIMTDRKSVV